MSTYNYILKYDNLGINLTTFSLESDYGEIIPTTCNRQELLDGLTITVDTLASKVTITSTSTERCVGSSDMVSLILTEITTLCEAPTFIIYYNTGSTQVTLDVTFNENCSTGEIEASQNINFINPLKWETNCDSTQIINLSNTEGTWYIRVREKCTGGNFSDWSEVSTITYPTPIPEVTPTIYTYYLSTGDTEWIKNLVGSESTDQIIINPTSKSYIMGCRTSINEPSFLDWTNVKKLNFFIKSGNYVGERNFTVRTSRIRYCTPLTNDMDICYHDDIKWYPYEITLPPNNFVLCEFNNPFWTKGNITDRIEIMIKFKYEEGNLSLLTGLDGSYLQLVI